MLITCYQHLKPLLIIPILGLAILAGLYIPRFLLAQEALPQVGHGALHRVEILDSSKCTMHIKVWLNNDEGLERQLALSSGQCNRFTGGELAATATQLLQEALDNCQLLTDLPIDDPDRTTDPIVTNSAQKSLKWILKPDGFTYLCSSPVTVTVIWNGTEYNLEWRSTNAG